VRKVLNNEGQNLLFCEARSHRSWLDEPVEGELLRAVYDLAKMGPTSSNSCPLRMVFVVSGEAKEKLMAHMDEVDIKRIETPSGRAVLTLINGERLNIDWETLNETDPEIGSKVRVRKADLELFRAGVATGMISMELADSVSKVSPYRQVKVTRK